MQTSLFLRVGSVGDLFIKVPSERGLSDYRAFAQLGNSREEDLRSLEDTELRENLNQTLESFAEPKPVPRVNTEVAHYLVIPKLQQERLRKQTAVMIPRAKFGYFKREAFVNTSSSDRGSRGGCSAL